MSRCVVAIRQAVRGDTPAQTRWVVALVLVVTGLVALNSVFHPWRKTYDANGHLNYARALSELRWPRADETNEFFNPPLTYVFPALLRCFGASHAASGRAWQGVNVALSVVTLLYTLRLCDLFRANDGRLKCTALLLILLCPTYFRTFAQARPETYLLPLCTIIAFHTCAVLARGNVSKFEALRLGVWCGVALLCRQWAVPFCASAGLAVLVVAWRDRPARGQLLRAAGVVLGVATVLSAPFYVSLHVRFGSALAFNRAVGEVLNADETTEPAAQTSVSNGLQTVLHLPLRPRLTGHPALIFYADLWGDYWCFFHVYGIDRPTRTLVPSNDIPKLVGSATVDTNYATAGPYLGRVALLGVFPTALVALGLLAGIASVRREGASAPPFALAVMVAGSVLGYAWFVHTYPHHLNDTVKATYLAHLWPLCAVLGASTLLGRNGTRARTVIGLTLLGLIALHDLPACVTGYFPQTDLHPGPDRSAG